MNLLIKVKIHPNSSKQEILKVNDLNFAVYLHEPALENRANISLIKLFAKYYKIKQSSITIIKGLKSRNKVIEIKFD